MNYRDVYFYALQFEAVHSALVIVWKKGKEAPNELRTIRNFTRRTDKEILEQLKDPNPDEMKILNGEPIQTPVYDDEMFKNFK